MGRNRESRTGIAVLAFIVASTAAQFNSPADLRDDCTDKSDGIYPTGHCSTYFLECSGGKTTKQNCSTGLWFNPQSSQCDYRENIVACQDSFSCIGRDDGVYGEGCSSMFWYCSGGQLKHSICPNGTFFNPQSQQCDFRNKIKACGDSTSSSVQNTRSNRLTTVTPTTQSPSTEAKLRDWTEVPYGQTYPTYAPRQRISGRVSKTPLDESSAGTACAGKEDGSHSMDKCSGQYVLCWAGTGKVMNCQKGLLFNEVSHVCDYPLNVDGCNGSPSASLDKSYGRVVSAAPSTASLPIPRQPIENGESEKAGRKKAIDFDCSSLPDGSYSQGCISEFYQCSSGMAIIRKCPDGLVFDHFTKACDYPQICSSPHSSVSHDLMSSVSSPPSTTPIPITSSTLSFDCSSRVDGLYSEGCVSHFFQCSSRVVSSYLCPDGLLFDGVSQKCDYPNKCGQPRPLDEDSSVYNLSPTVPSSDYNKKNLQKAPISIDCSSVRDGLYGSCSSSFIQCVAGMAYTQQCPQGLVFDEKNGSCNYPERCGKISDAVEVPVMESSSVQSVQESLTPINIDCFNRPDGLYSSGCSRTYVQCVNGMTFNQLCQEGLVFIQSSGVCDYTSSCSIVSSSPSSTVPYAPSPPSSSLYKPSVVNETPAPPPKRDEPSGVVIDCSTLANGRYTSGCTHAFVECTNGAAVPLECPAGLVFDKRVDQCVWPQSCSSMDSPSLPIVSLPIRPSDVPSTVYDMKEEKDEMVTDASLPQVSKDGSVCTGTGRRAMGKCSSGFVQCIGGKMVARRCPGQSLFDEKIGLCVYDMDGCEMDVDIVDGNEEEPTVAATVTPQQDISSTGYNRQPVQSAPSYAQQTSTQSVYQQQYSQNSPQDQYQNGYPAQAAPTQYQNGYQAQAVPFQYQNGYQSVPAYPTSGYQSAPQSTQYQTGYGFESVPVYSSFDDSSLSQSHSSPECVIGSFRRVSACSPSFDTCSPTARQWIRRICGKSHRFDSTVNRCRPIFEIRECDEPMSSYIPPPVQMEVPAVYPNPATSFENGVPLSGREYEENHVRDPFKGGYQSGMMGSNPFVAIGNTGSFYTEDGLRWVGSAWSEGRRRGGKRHHKQRHHHHHSGDYVIVSGNPFGAGRDRVLNDEWEGRRRYDGPVRSSLTHAKGHRVRNVEDNFKGRVSHFAPPLRDVNPFAVKRGDGYRRKGRKSCRRDKHRRRDDWKDEDCEEEKELERPTARSLIDENDENEEERGMEMEEELIEENEDTESMEESTVKGETEEESEGKELEVNEDENEKNETDPELLPESIEKEDTNEINEVNEEENDEEKEEKNEEDEDEEGKEVKEETDSFNEDEEDVDETEKTEENKEEDEEVKDVKEETEDSTEENEDGEVDEIEKTEENEETTTMKGPFEEVDDKIEERKNEEDEDDDDEEDEEESVNESTEEESSDGKNIEERAESESGEENQEKENVIEVSDEEIEEEGETTEETANEDVESPESVEKEENAENERDEETEDGNTNENEEIEAENGGETEEIEEEGEMTVETTNEDVESPESIEKEENTDDNGGETEEINEDGKNEKEEVDGEKEDEESEKASEAVDRTEENEDEKVEEEDEIRDEETDQDQMKESEEDDPENPESIDNEVKEEDEVEKTEENEETTTMKGPFEEVDDMIEERKNEDEDDEADNDSSAAEGGNVEEIAETGEEMEETENGVEDEVEKVEDENIEEVVDNEDEKNEGEVDGDESNTEEVEDNKNGAEELKGVEMQFEENENTKKSKEEITEEENEEMNEESNEEADNQNVGNNEEDSENLPDAVENMENRRRRRSIVYDGSSTQSSSSSSIPRRLSIHRSSRLHRSRFSRLCVSSSTGQIISIGQCRQDFIYCKSTRRPVVAACPVGDLFDALESTCVPTEICGAERVKMDISSPTPSSSLFSYIREGERPTMPIPTDSIVNDNEKKTLEDTNDCSSLSDGAYPISGCSSHYFVCSASVKHMYTCPSGLIYHKGSDGCEWPINVADCTGGAASDTTSSPVSIPTENEYSGHFMNRDILATTVPTTVSPLHVHFDCVKNGGFAIDCKGGFVMCSNGISSFMKCSPSLVFDDATQACQYPAHVGSCGLTSSSVLDVPSTFSPEYTPSTTSSSPAMAVETLVTTPVHKDACIGGSNSLEGANKVCATSFVICKEGEVTAVMNCPDGTFFNEKTKECDYREVACAGGWNGEAQGVESPVEEDVPTVSTVIESEEYNRRASRPYRPLMPVVVEKIEKNEEVKNNEVIVERPMVIPSNIEPSKDAICDWKGAASSGSCSSQFITCSNGRPEVMLCSSGLVFSSSTSACEYPIFVPGCPQFKSSSPYIPSLPSTPSPVSDAVIIDESSSSSSEYTEYTRPSIPSTTTVNPLLAPIENGEHTTSKFEATGDPCTFFADRPAFPLNYCSMTFAVCTAQGMAYRTNCSFGFLFDSVLRQCVPSEHCGQPYIKDIAAASPTSSSPHHTLGGWEKDSRCVGMKDGTLKAMDICSGQYIKCFKEEVLVQSCSGTGRVFSALTGRCVMQVQMAECSSPKGSIPAITRPKNVSPSTPSSDALSSSSSSDSYSTSSLPIPSHRGSRIRGGLPISSSSTQFDASTFCITKHTDGLYRNPENCAGIIQCFGGEAFSYPSCAPGLFFNEVDSQCDYASNVPECVSQTDPIALDDTSAASCKGQPHGAHLADDSDCSIYYRCVWGSLERLTCPDGTVFNPRLSVCDYSSQVPHCLTQ